jgi:hypothetical protein
MSGKVATTSLIEREFYDRLEGVRSGNLCNKVLQAGWDCDCLEECKYSKDSGLSVQSVNSFLVLSPPTLPKNETGELLPLLP